MIPLTTKVYDQIPPDFAASAVIVACHVNVDGHILFLERSLLEESSGLWGLPAGKLEPGEDEVLGALRELWEETGIAADASQLRDLGTLYLCKPTHHLLYHSFEICLDQKPSISLSHEHTSYAWIPLGEWSSLPLLEGAEEALSFYFRG